MGPYFQQPYQKAQGKKKLAGEGICTLLPSHLVVNKAHNKQLSQHNLHTHANLRFILKQYIAEEALNTVGTFTEILSSKIIHTK